MLRTCSSYGAPSSSSSVSVADERVCGEWYRAIVSFAVVVMSSAFPGDDVK
jgi:hypothetical protein